MPAGYSTAVEFDILFCMNSNKRIVLLPLFIIVILNYLAQIPYDIHLYHGHFSILGTILLFLTFVWFFIGYLLTKKRKKTSYWLLLSFLLVQVIFYFYNEIVLSFYGYGIMYHFFHSKDWILWSVFFIGDINFITACYYSYYLIKKKALFR